MALRDNDVASVVYFHQVPPVTRRELLIPCHGKGFAARR